MKLILFDFDGTITSKDSFIGFIHFYNSNRFKTIFGMISLLPFFILYSIKIISREELKEKILVRFFKNISKEVFLSTCYIYSQKYLDQIVLPSALKEIKKYKEKGDVVVIVSASLKYWLEPWCKKYDLDLIATEMEFINNFSTGKIINKNCYGAEKVNKIKEKYTLGKFEKVIAYGNSKGDHEMLNLAQESFYKYFH